MILWSEELVERIVVVFTVIRSRKACIKIARWGKRGRDKKLRT